MILMEKAGLPSAAFTASHFIHDARSTADVLGLPEVPLVLFPEVITNQTSESLARMVAQVVDDVVEALTRPPKPVKQFFSTRSGTETIQGDDFMDCFERFNRLFVEREWSDGLPLVPPTRQAVERMIAAYTLPAEHVVVNGLHPGLGVATAEKIAINGVMAGCHPEHMPVLVALAKAYEGLGVIGKMQAMSTGPNAPLVLVSGPVVERLRFNYKTCVMGPGSPSHVNTVIGRALRLMLMNIGQCYPGSMDMDTLGTPNKYSFCLAENAARTPWETWNVQRGFDRDASTLSINCVYPGPDIYDFTATTPQEMLDTLITLTGSYTGVISVGRWFYGGRPDPDTKEAHHEVHQLILAPTHADLMRKHGWTKADIQEYVHTRSRIPFKKLYTVAVKPIEKALKACRPELMWLLDQPETMISMAEGPQYYEVFVTGGDAGRSQFLYGGSDISTVAIDLG